MSWFANSFCNAYETWLSATDIPEDALSQVSARTLSKIGKADAAQRVNAIDKIRKGEGFSEGDLNKLLKKNSKPSETLEELLSKSEVVSKKKTDDEKVKGFTDLMMENIKLKQKVKDLEEQLKKAKAKV